jgi:colanic acid biosynthesis glycosyl transferase WcaI
MRNSSDRESLSIGAVSRDGQHAGVEAMVRLHQNAFPSFFATSLGPRFLRMLYRGFLHSETGVCVVARNGDELIGFAAGTTDPDLFFRALLRKKGAFLALAAIPALICNPLFVIRKCLGAFFYRGEPPKTLPKAGLLSSLAVSPQAENRGVGRQLVEAFCRELTQRGIGNVYLTTDASDNDRVNRFYTRCGFRLVDSFERPGKRLMNRWARTLNRASEQQQEVA